MAKVNVVIEDDKYTYFLDLVERAIDQDDLYSQIIILQMFAENFRLDAAATYLKTKLNRSCCNHMPEEL